MALTDREFSQLNPSIAQPILVVNAIYAASLFDTGVVNNVTTDDSIAAGLRYCVTGSRDRCIELQLDADAHSWPARFNAATQYGIRCAVMLSR